MSARYPGLRSVSFAALLVVWLAASALWGRSLWRVDAVGYTGAESADRRQRGGYASSGAGLLSGQWWHRENPPRGSRPTDGFGFTSWPLRGSSNLLSGRGFLGFDYRCETFSVAWPNSDGSPPAGPVPQAVARTLTVPWWAVWVAATAACMPGARRRWRTGRARRRQRAGLCPACGYDVRCNTDRCPECGTAITGFLPARAKKA